ncbi:MAG TPA: hypothetical protein VNY73_04955 [Bacteroidia bacterium]|jgi:hypothetical protein|nr:hypothetical protein [Bacteroidia bacterium]
MEKIELRRVRDFGALFNDGIAFIRVNFKSFFGVILVLAGPFIILTGLLSGYMQSIQSKLVSGSFFSSYFGGSPAGLLSANFIGTLSIFLLIYLLTTLVTSACVCLYLKAYDRSNRAELPLDKNSVSPFLAAASWRLFYNILLLSLILVVGGAALTGIFVVLFMIPVLNVLFGIALVIGALIALPVIFYLTYVANYIVIRDEVLITVAIRKAIDYMRGNFWWTWLLMFSLIIALSTISGLFSLPLSVLNITKMFTRGSDPAGGSDSSIIYLIFGTLSMVAQMLILVPLSTVFCVFNFHSHEEQSEGTGLLGRIDELDTDK